MSGSRTVACSNRVSRHGPCPVSYCARSTARGSSLVEARVWTSRRRCTTEMLACSAPGTVPTAPCTIALNVCSTSSCCSSIRESSLSRPASSSPAVPPVSLLDGAPLRMPSRSDAPSLRIGSPVWYRPRAVGATPPHRRPANHTSTPFHRPQNPAPPPPDPLDPWSNVRTAPAPAPAPGRPGRPLRLRYSGVADWGAATADTCAGRSRCLLVEAPGPHRRRRPVSGAG